MFKNDLLTFGIKVAIHNQFLLLVMHILKVESFSVKYKQLGV